MSAAAPLPTSDAEAPDAPHLQPAAPAAAAPTPHQAYLAAVYLQASAITLDRYAHSYELVAAKPRQPNEADWHAKAATTRTQAEAFRAAAAALVPVPTP